MNYIKVNKATWDKRTLIHLDSNFYDLPGFIEGNTSLNEIELKEVGEVKNKSLLHLQCHFGQDTLSWARLGAEVTGVDLSSEAISQAEKLAEKTGIKARFICDDIYQFGLNNTQEFDIVYTSYGVLCWLPDLDLWAQTIARSLRPGGQFNLIEFHPFNDVLSGYSYFSHGNADIEKEGTYTENCTGEKLTTHTWPHSMSEVINALINAGIIIKSVNEHIFSPYDCFEDAEFVENKGYKLKFKDHDIPLIYSIKGTKSA